MRLTKHSSLFPPHVIIFKVFSVLKTDSVIIVNNIAIYSFREGSLFALQDTEIIQEVTKF